MKRLLVHCPSPNDATSLYRGIGPFARLQKQEDLLLMSPSEVTWTSAALVDAAFLQRPFRQDHLRAVQNLKDAGVPVWLDYDDDLFTVPRDNPTFPLYGLESTQKVIAQLLAMADVVTVSTPHLKARLERVNQNVVVVPNAIDDWTFEYRSDRGKKREPVVLWRGGKTHQKDLMHVSRQLNELMRKPSLGNWVWQFMGDNPFWVTDEMPANRVICSPQIDPIQYMRFLEKVNPALMIVPLYPNEFNLSKSNIAWIEGSFAGAAVIAPDIPEFRRPGVLLYKSPEHFGSLVEEAMLGRHDLVKLNEASWQDIRVNYTLSETNKIRSAVLCGLLGRSRGFLRERGEVFS